MNKKDNWHFIANLEELRSELEEWKQEGKLLLEESIDLSIRFFKESLQNSLLPFPDIEVHPDGEVAFTWRKEDKGIISIAFSADGIATWAAFLEKKQEETIKGSFKVADGMDHMEDASPYFKIDRNN